MCELQAEVQSQKEIHAQRKVEMYEMQQEDLGINRRAINRARVGMAITVELIVAVEVMFLLRWLALMG